MKCGHGRSTNASSYEVVPIMSSGVVMDIKNVGKECDRYSGAIQWYILNI